MHYHGPVLAGLCFMYRELAGTVVAELLADAFPVHVVEAVFQYAARVPVAPDSVTFGFVVFWILLPEPFACHSAAHAVRVEAAACANVLWIIHAVDGAVFASPEFFVQKNVLCLGVAERCRILADVLLECIFLT